MRVSQFLLATVKETPTDAEIVSHRLMLRAGLIRKLAAGLYTWLPLGLRALRKVERVVREEMDRAGAHEVLMPAVQPAELWQESGRWEQYGPELLRLKDRHQRDFCFGPTHEEVITDLIRREIKSYRQLPATFYQIQTKFRDEIRPRFGVMRAREFLMKDAYSFHLNHASLQQTYDLMMATYSRIFTRLGLEFRAVQADTGAIGGNLSHEFHVLADSGEDAIAFCPRGDYAANVELAEAVAPQAKRPAPSQPLREVTTPGQRSIEEVAAFLHVPAQQTVKTLLVEGKDGDPVQLLLRGDHRLSETKAAKLPDIAQPLRFATEERIRAYAHCAPGFIGPVDGPRRSTAQRKIIADRSVVVMSDFVCGANKDGYHLSGVNFGRDLGEPQAEDIRQVVEGDPCPRCATPMQIRRGIEVGHIFQLGTKYSAAMQATCLDEAGKAVTMTMGCYGIGVSRVVAAAIEQNHDEFGIIWPGAIAPFQVALVPIGLHKSPALAQAAETFYIKLMDAGFEVLFDDRNERPGVIFADIDLIGIPHRLVLGERGLDRGIVEYKARRGRETQEWPLDQVIDRLREKLDNVVPQK